MKTNTTPGPWRIQQSNIIRERGDGDFATDYFAGKGKESACVGTFTQGKAKEVNHAKADAKLIAAAPDMLLALQALLRAAQVHRWHVNSDEPDVIAAAKQVIRNFNA